MEPIRLMVVDLYHGDRVASFARARQAGVYGIIHKASEGAGMVDPKYARRRVRGRQAGLLWGAYHFGTGDAVEAQVDNFLKAAAPDNHTLVALDYEDNGAATMSLGQARQFLAASESRLARKAGLYSSNLIKQQLLGRIDHYCVSR